MNSEAPQISRTVHILGWTRAKILREFEQHAIQMNAQGQRLLDAVPLTPGDHGYAISTVELSVHDLGFAEGATSGQLFDAASAQGLDLCPLEAGPYLRLMFLDQAIGPWITVASEPVAQPDGMPNGFYLRRRPDGLWLRGYTASNDYVWPADDRFIFRVRRVEPTTSRA